MFRIISNAAGNAAGNVAGNVAIRPYEPSLILTVDTHERQMKLPGCRPPVEEINCQLFANGACS